MGELTGGGYPIRRKVSREASSLECPALLLRSPPAAECSLRAALVLMALGVSPSSILGSSVSPRRNARRSIAAERLISPGSGRRALVGLGRPSPTPDGPALPPDLLITCIKNIFDLKTPGVLVIFSVFRFVAALVCREQILFLNSSRNQEQPRPGTAGGALVSKLPSLAALCVGHRRCRVLGAKRKSCARPEHYRVLTQLRRRPVFLTAREIG